MSVENKVPCILKQYCLFGGDTWYACGGFRDLLGSYDTLEEASSYANAISKPSEDYVTWWHIIDLSTGAFVEESEFTAQSGDDGDEHPLNIRYHNGEAIFTRDFWGKELS